MIEVVDEWKNEMNERKKWEGRQKEAKKGMKEGKQKRKGIRCDICSWEQLGTNTAVAVVCRNIECVCLLSGKVCEF